MYRRTSSQKNEYKNNISTPVANSLNMTTTNHERMNEKRRFICTTIKCGWKFSARDTQNLCPYCGQRSVQQDTTRGAQDLIEEIEDIEDQMGNR